jgi:hypothetical protein
MAIHPEGVRARDDQEVGVPARCHGGADAFRGFFLRIELLRSARVFPGAGVVLDMNRRDARSLESRHRAIESFRIRDDRDAHRIGDRPRVRD